MVFVFRISVLLILFLSATLSLPRVSGSSPLCRAWLVQSIPTDMPHLPRVPGVLSTGHVFKWLAGNSTERLDIIAQYWQLRAHPNDPRSGDYGYSKSDMQRFGAPVGSQVYKAIDDAADRNVSIRLLSHSGVYPDYTKEPSDLASGRPNVKNATLLLGKWWGSGIVHTKVWISDSRDVYIGSANNDWKSLTQLLFGRYQADEQAWVDTIKSVGDGAIVRINTMDWLGQSQYTKQTIYWSSLSSAVSEVIFSKHAKVKILVAYWAHFISNTDQYLKSLLYSNVLCSSSKYNKCSGKVEIKYYRVPGYNLTGPATSNGTNTGNIYPGFTRVNHGKYAVSDVRAHIGTSNLIWDYFYTTAGVSFGTYNPSIVSQLQEIFDADWNSPYATPIEEIGGAHVYSGK